MFTFPFTEYKQEDWSPLEIETTLWVDASDHNSITHTAGTVSVWNDKSGKDHHMNADGDPQTGVNTLNGLNIIDCDGTDWFSTGFAIPTFNGDIAIYMVCNIETVGETSDSAFSINASTPNNDFQFEANNVSLFNGRIRATGIGASKALTGGPYNGVPRIFENVYDFTGTTTYNAYMDGVKATTDTTYATQMGLTNPVNFIAFTNRGEAKTPEGYIAEIVIVPDTSLSMRQCIEGYLAHKWGLTANLPDNHPYKHLTPKKCYLNPQSLNPEFWYSPDDLVVGIQTGWVNSGTAGTGSNLVVMRDAVPSPPHGVDIINDTVIQYNVMRLNTEFTQKLLEMPTSSITPQSSYAMFMVVKSTDGIANDQDFYFGTNGPYGPSDILHWVYASGTHKLDVVGSGNQNDANILLGNDVWHVIGIHQEDINTVTLFTDAEDKETHTLGTATSSKKFDKFQLCGWNDGTNYQKWLHADIAEIIIIAHSISSDEAASVQQFLNVKYQTPVESV